MRSARWPPWPRRRSAAAGDTQHWFSAPTPPPWPRWQPPPPAAGDLLLRVRTLARRPLARPQAQDVDSGRRDLDVTGGDDAKEKSQSVCDGPEKFGDKMVKFFADVDAQKQSLLTFFGYAAIATLSLVAGFVKLFLETKEIETKDGTRIALILSMMTLVSKTLYQCLKQTKDIGEVLAFFWTIAIQAARTVAKQKKLDSKMIPSRCEKEEQTGTSDSK